MSASAEQSTKDLQASETMAQATAEGKAEGSTERVNEKQVEEIAALRGQLKEQHDHLTGMHEGMTKLLGELAITGNLLTSMDPAAEVREPEDIRLKETVEEMAKAALQERQRAVDERPAMDLAALRKELSGQHTSMAGMHTAQAELLDRLQTVTTDQGALLRQLNESQALLREQIALNAKHTNTIDNYMVENEALRGQLNTHQRILLDMHDQLVALVQLHKLTVREHVLLHTKLEECESRVRGSLVFEPEQGSNARGKDGEPNIGEQGGSSASLLAQSQQGGSVARLSQSEYTESVGK